MENSEINISQKKTRVESEVNNKQNNTNDKVSSKMNIEEEGNNKLNIFSKNVNIHPSNNNSREQKKQEKIKSSIIKQKENLFYIICQCSKFIYLSTHDIFKINGRNIKCQCANCGKFSYITICPKCRKDQIIHNFIHEGELIKCEFCSFSYLQTICPVKNCKEMFYFPEPKNFSNSPNGIIHSHKNILMFQKITCFFCLKPIVYFVPEDAIQYRYYETVRVTCPYEDCGKSFNRIICPKCCEIIYIESGLYIMGKKIKCFSCKYEFAKILCPICLKVNPLIKNVFTYGEFECRYSSCNQISLIANCLHCLRINYFKYEKKSLIPGQIIQCAYEDCGRKFCSPVCPGCNEINPFPNADFKFGKIYKCKNHAKCSKYFLILVCANCGSYSRITDSVEGKKYTCNCCGKMLANIQCPFCQVSLLDIKGSCNYGQMCECHECKKHFSFFRCFNCKRLIYSKENQCILGKYIICQNCNKISVNILCPNSKCNSKISFPMSEYNTQINEEINCPNCQITFKYENKSVKEFDKIYTDFKTIECIKGNPIIFCRASKDENYIEKSKFLLNKEEYNKMDTDDVNNIINNENVIYQKKNNNLCIICQSKEKESIFYPCGHRCSCYSCAIYYFEVNKKCPKCDQKAICIIPKVFS